MKFLIIAFFVTTPFLSFAWKEQIKDRNLPIHHRIATLTFKLGKLCHDNASSPDADCETSGSGADATVARGLIQEAVDEWNAVFDRGSCSIPGTPNSFGNSYHSLGSGSSYSRFQIRLDGNPDNRNSKVARDGVNTIVARTGYVNNPFVTNAVSNATGIIINKEGEILEADLEMPNYLPAHPTTANTRLSGAALTTFKNQYKAKVMQQIGLALGLKYTEGTIGSNTCSDNNPIACTTATRTNGNNEIMKNSGNLPALVSDEVVLDAKDKEGACFLYGGFRRNFGGRPQTISLYEGFGEYSEGRGAFNSSSSNITNNTTKNLTFKVEEGAEDRNLFVEVIVEYPQNTSHLQIFLTYPSGAYERLYLDSKNRAGKILPAYPGDYQIRLHAGGGREDDPTGGTRINFVVGAYLGDNTFNQSNVNGEFEVTESSSVFRSQVRLFEEVDNEAFPRPNSRDRDDFELTEDRPYHYFLIQVSKPGDLTIESIGNYDMVGSLCNAATTDTDDDNCVEDDDSGSDGSSDGRNFEISVNNLEVGDYILSVSEFGYGDATYDLRYSFDPDE